MSVPGQGGDEASGRLHPVLGHVLRVLALIAISGTFLWIAARGVRLEMLTRPLGKIDLIYAPILASSIAGMFVLKTIRWQWLLASLKPVRFAPVLGATIIGFAANNVLPFRSGDVVRAYAMKTHAGVPTTILFATVALDRIFEVFSVLTIALILSLLVPLPS